MTGANPANALLLHINLTAKQRHEPARFLDI
jgi:hypothetical protein